MNILNLVQGSDEWLKVRQESFTASEAPAMMGASKYVSRNQLLDMKKGKKTEEIDDFTKALFQKGHDAEDAAREHVEMDLMMDLPQAVGTLKVRGLKHNLLSSFDGRTEDGFLIWEHKLWNAVLAENVTNEILDDLYIWQLEQQMLVAGVDQVNFTVSDGTFEKRVSMIYSTVPAKRKQLIAGWKQFEKDLATHEILVRQEVIVARTADALPDVSFQVNGSMIVSNIAEVLPAIEERAQLEMARALETDQDFADKDDLNKEVKAARESLKATISSVKGEFQSFAEFSEVAEKIDKILQKMQSAGEKQVKDAKEQKKRDIAEKGKAKIAYCVAAIEKQIAPFMLSQIGVDASADLNAAMKGKRTIASLKSAVDDLVAITIIDIEAAADLIIVNLAWFRSFASDYDFLFNDAVQIINQPEESFQAVVKSRISDHKEREAQKKIDEQKRAEESAKFKEASTPEIVSAKQDGLQQDLEAEIGVDMGKPGADQTVQATMPAGLQIHMVSFGNLTVAEQNCQPDNGAGKESASYIKIIHNGDTVALYSDAMEPEDASFNRDLSWITNAIQSAYELGRKA